MQPALSHFDEYIDRVFTTCAEKAANIELEREIFAASIHASIDKFVNAAEGEPPSSEETFEFLERLHAEDLYLALACSHGNEKAWWQFDSQYRPYIEAVGRHLAASDASADDVIELVYTDLFGTRVVDGKRVSKFASYSGRGSLRGWLRTVIWHSLVDLHRIERGDVSLDEMAENVGEGAAHSYFNLPSSGGEDEAVETIERNRFGPAVIVALDNAFKSLEDHERLLLLYYHVERLTLREIAQMLKEEESVLRRWFKKKAPGSERTHESTVMRWLDRTHAKVLESFRSELRTTHGFNEEELARCAELVIEDLPNTDVFRKLQK